jgi:hypothetical protein
MTTPFPFTSGQVLTAAQMNAITTLPINNQTASYTLLASDAGKRVIMNVGSANTVTVDDDIFSAGDTIFIANIGTATTTITEGSGVDIESSGSLALAQYGGGTLIALSASTFTFFPSGGIGSANFSDAATGTYTDSGINYKYLTYTASGTLTVTNAGLADLLIIGGGGGGGNAAAGGGGGYLAITDAYLSAGTLTVTVGAGGAVGGNEGVTSRVGSYYSAGGGTIGFVNNGTIGGSGGAGVGAGTGGAGIPTLGNNGGDGASTAGGGGGGAGAVGANATSGNGGAGGAGASSSITGSAVSRAGGGGGGGTSSGGSATDGGGAGSVNTGTAGTANTGGGGGGGWNVASAAGGSGVVIVRVKV